MSIIAGVRTLADSTPSERNRAVDALRAVSILVVVFGHWLMAAVTVQDGALVPGHLLEMAEWTHPLTWVLQVMPVFFVVGGYANGVSWRSARRKGEPYGAWLRTRLRRLVLPVMPLLAVWALGGWIALVAGIDPGMLQLASQVALVPTWFLAAYVVVVTVVPATMWLWERAGWRSVVGGALLAGLVDAVSLLQDLPPLGFVNYLVVWATVHQVGYAWLDDRLGGTARRLLLAAAGLLTTAALVALAPYPVAMVGLDGAEVANSYPPRVTLVALGVFQAGAILALERPLRSWLERRGVWRIVVAVNTHIMSLYLWHLTAMVVILGVSLFAEGAGLGVRPLTVAWWLTRPVWMAVLSLATLILAAVFGRFERPRPDPRPSPAPWRPLLGVLAVCSGLGLLAAAGVVDGDGLNGLALSLPVIGLLAGGVGDVTGLGSPLADRRGDDRGLSALVHPSDCGKSH